MEEMNNMQVGFDEDSTPMNVDFDDLPDHQTIVRYAIDDSLSMDDDDDGNSYVDDVRMCLEDNKKAIEESKQSDEMIVGKTLFGDKIKEGPYCLISDFDTSYVADGWCTKLFDAIIASAESVKAAVDKLKKQQFSVRGMLAILSDGIDNYSTATERDAAQKLSEIQKDTGIIVYYIEFGPHARGIASRLGIPQDRILTPGSGNMPAEERRKQLRAAFKFISKSGISISQGGKAPSVDNGMFDVD